MIKFQIEDGAVAMLMNLPAHTHGLNKVFRLQPGNCDFVVFEKIQGSRGIRRDVRHMNGIQMNFVLVPKVRIPLKVMLEPCTHWLI